MRKLIMFLSINFILLLFINTSLQASSKIEYMGGLGLCASGQEKLKDWYEKFGFYFIKYGIAYKAVKGEERVQFHFAIYPTGKTGEFCKEPSNAGFGIFYVVTKLDAFVQDLKIKGFYPIKLYQDSNGVIAQFRDPERNRINIWEKPE